MKITKTLIFCIAGIAALIGAATAILIFRDEIVDFIVSMKEKYLDRKSCCCDESDDFADL